ncbi:magnesium and cobalt transporter CorA [Neisseria bacilliformis ATCC BAA-1200]|uniref:Magnesium and cobalt transporter CorA n=1 Tax=Neisseria bacilliformis ATCC BAA-1200 TaxID=888742 RepID=F2BB30_9NEIS|nr:magnesium and cobalt transporter CorA [Neisseria bacilliformis ATCC BAA-1200]
MLQWDGGRLKNGGLFAAVFSDGLGRVDIQLLQRILRHKTADARRKCEPMPVHRRVFATRQMPF